MRKKFTMLLASLFLVLGSAWAQTAITAVDELNHNSAYTIKTLERGYLYYDETNPNNVTSVSHTTITNTEPDGSANQLFAFLRNESMAEGSYYIYSIAASKFVTYTSGVALQLTEEPQSLWAVVKDGDYFLLKVPGTNDTYINVTNEANGASYGCKVASTGPDGGNKMTIKSWSLSGDLTAAIAKLPKPIPAIGKGEFDATKTYRVFSDALGSNEAWAPNDGKTMGALKSYNEEDRNQLWKFIEGTGDNAGKYKIYNVGINKYMGAVGGANGVSLVDNEANATYYTIAEHATDNKYAFHHSGGSNPRHWLYNDGDGKLAGWNGNGKEYFYMVVSDADALDLMKSDLQAAIDEAQTLYDGLAETDYTEAIDLSNAITAARDLLAGEPTEDAIRECLGNLTHCIDLVEKYSYPFVPSLVKVIQPGRYNIYYTDANEQKHYLQTTGSNTVKTVTESPIAYEISAGTTDGGLYTTAYALKMNNLYISNTSQNQTNIETKPGLQLWSSQVLFEKNGKIAIRLTNAQDNNQGWHGHYFLNVSDNETTVAADPSLGDALFIWSIEESSAEQDLQSLISETEAFINLHKPNASKIGYYTQEALAELEEAVETAKNSTETPEATLEALQTVKNQQLAVNMPAKGKFYRFKKPAADAYMLSDVYVHNGKNMLAMGAKKGGENGQNEITSIFYYGEDGTILSYALGRYLSEAHDQISSDWTCKPVGTENPPVATFGAGYNLGTVGFYVGNTNTRAYYSGHGNRVDAGGSIAANANYDWEVEAVEYLPVKMNTQYGYATVCSPVALSTYRFKSTSEHRVEAYIGEINIVDKNAWLHLERVDEGDGIIPANTPVVLKYLADVDNTGYVFLQIVESNKTLGEKENHIKGMLATAVNDKKEPANCYYTLQPNETGDGVVFKGFNGENLKGFSAYLELPDNAPSGAIGIRFEGTTDIEHSEIRNQHSEMIFDLLGRRVEAITKGGIYIVNGKKVVVK